MPSIRVRGPKAEKLTDLAVHVRIEIDQPFGDTSHVSESLGEGTNHPSLVASVMIYGRVRIFFSLLDKHRPD